MNVVNTTHVVFFYEKPWITMNLRLECWMNLGEPGRWIHTLRTLFFETLCWPFFVPKKCWGLGLLDANSLHRGYVILRNAMPPKRFEASMHPVPAETKDDEVIYVYTYIYIYVCIYIYTYIYMFMRYIYEVLTCVFVRYSMCEVYVRYIWGVYEVYMWGVYIYIYIYNIYIMFMYIYIYMWGISMCNMHHGSPWSL